MAEPSSKPVKPIDQLRLQFNSPAMKAQLKDALPPHVSVDKFIRVTMSLLQSNPKLLACDRSSLFASVMTIAQLGLMPDPVLGEAYVVEFKGKATVIVGYRGYMKLTRQSGEVKSLFAELIHERDEFHYIAGTERKLVHRPVWGSDPGKVIGAYSVAELTDGFTQFVVMSIAEIERIRENANSRNSPAWTGIGRGEMIRKTALRRLLKYLPMTIDPAALGDEDDDSVVSEQTQERPQLERARMKRLDHLAQAGTPEPTPTPDEPEPEPEPTPDDDGDPFQGVAMPA